MDIPKLTIFTPTYNRSHTLSRLHDSLVKQSLKDFEWLVVDDGSSDNTAVLFENWTSNDNGFQVRYIRIPNGGKNRAINLGIKEASGRYFMILDSDDMLSPNAVEFIIEKMPAVEIESDFIGISGKKGDLNGVPLGAEGRSYNEDGYTDCSNIERSKYGLERDMAEVFITEKLRRYEFKVWQGEKFTPEEVVWNQMALDGYRLRWYNKVIYLCEYQSGGLTDSTWSLLRNNPMGYAIMFDQRLEIYPALNSRINNALQYGACCFLGGEYRMLVKSRCPLLTLALAPAAWVVALRRRRQFKIYK